VPAHTDLVRRDHGTKGHMEMTRVRRHRRAVGAVSLAVAGLAAGLWLAVPASASTSSQLRTSHSSTSGTATLVSRATTQKLSSRPGRAIKVSGTVAPAPSGGSLPNWTPAGSGPPPGPGGPPHWTPAGSGPPPAP
jgi:hypothetical protein